MSVEHADRRLDAATVEVLAAFALDDEAMCLLAVVGIDGGKDVPADEFVGRAWFMGYERSLWQGGSVVTRCHPELRRAVSCPAALALLAPSDQP